MKDEIKEIFNKYGKSHSEDDYCLEYETYIVELKELKELYDYITNLQEENERLNNIIEKLEEDLDYEINDYKGNIDMEEKTLSGEFCRGMAFEADYLKNRIENLKEGK